MRIAWLLLCLPHVALAAPFLRTEGVATTAQGAILYREVHWQRGADEGAERWVQYLCPDGRAFARKHMPAATRPLARGYDLQDQRSGQNANIQVIGRMVRIDWQEDAAATPRQKRLALPDNAVIDAGFDAAVRRHWPALMRGEKLNLPFLVPGRQRFYPVNVQHRGPVQWQGMDAQSIEVSLGTWYGSVAPRLSLVYADADRRLLEFRGTSNLLDPSDNYPQVVVRFPMAASERRNIEWQQAWAQPLVSKCSVNSK